MVNNAERRRLLALPPELRNRIWDYVLPQGVTLPISTPWPSILQVNKQIREEARSLYLANNIFECSIISTAGVDLWSSWFDHLRSDARHLRVLKLSNRECECNGDNCLVQMEALIYNIEITLNGKSDSESARVKVTIEELCVLRRQARVAAAEQAIREMEKVIAFDIARPLTDKARDNLGAALGMVAAAFLRRSEAVRALIKASGP